MWILIFSTDDHLYPAGGAEQAFGHITARLPDIEFDLICAKLRKGVSNFERVGNINIYRMGFGIPKIDAIIVALFGHLMAYKLMKKRRYDLLWSIMASYGAFSAVRVKRKTGVPILLTLQEGDSFEHIYRRVRWVRSSFDEIFTSADGIQAISHFLLRWGKEMGFTGSNGKVIPNGVDIAAFTKPLDEAQIRETRASFGFPDHATILFTSSRLEKKNGVVDVVRALSLLPPEVCFVICGSGSLEKEIQEEVQKRGLLSRVLFKGFVDPSELPLLMKSSDLFIRPSLTEGLGNAFLEAMAAGLITIGTNAGGIPDFLKDGETGFVVSIEDPDSIAETVLKIRSEDDATISEIKDRALHMVVTTYNWESIALQMKALFEVVIKKV